MKTARLVSSVLSLAVLAGLGLSCGSGSSRQLQSITIAQTVKGEEISFVATGNFSSAPTKVTPLPASWGIGPFAPPPAQWAYTLTSQPFTFNCTGTSGPYQPVGAFAPTDPNAPSSGTTKSVVIGYAPIKCP